MFHHSQGSGPDPSQKRHTRGDPIAQIKHRQELREKNQAARNSIAPKIADKKPKQTPAASNSTTTGNVAEEPQPIDPWKYLQGKIDKLEIDIKNDEEKERKRREEERNKIEKPEKKPEEKPEKKPEEKPEKKLEKKPEKKSGKKPGKKSGKTRKRRGKA
ncbi:hypothetical protein BCIN_15g04380 [Botrytis cinerea B05.10]|uniref:Uncharacterized protein n=1 Tax=Botryotinia fuckeliana (strain B05.10) TaxID=332648 RepID=A0A384K5K2_BOTFB|nr:hypothetical protein BCIN_15g04380 [Botrytis cinerea B05.10]ATZ57934.1 hypothetical protein BCIN_15g04380 [Botrytis cinerea B05.10]